ncbi:YraN family protein [Paenibacillus alkaliterrae]|uniref:YraN family protein n=1 Tax=Paenibacillus alkaliterrae TaxID=320909 RepID=UPI001F479BDF|nr:YraN family protein [Paenibacillus alkaliterrae]MCF2936990.1 YraN family protein [Paenibacillus alkaliterrae]
MSEKDQRIQTGKFGEDAACDYLIEADYKIVERNWRCRSGEIDIIADDAGRLVFIEVRTRKTGGRFGTAAESVDRRKQQQVRDTAQVYLRSIGCSAESIRFDVIAITMSRQMDSILEYKHYEGAF